MVEMNAAAATPRQRLWLQAHFHLAPSTVPTRSAEKASKIRWLSTPADLDETAVEDMDERLPIDRGVLLIAAKLSGCTPEQVRAALEESVVHRA